MLNLPKTVKFATGGLPIEVRQNSPYFATLLH